MLQRPALAVDWLDAVTTFLDVSQPVSLCFKCLFVLPLANLTFQSAAIYLQMSRERSHGYQDLCTCYDYCQQRWCFEAATGTPILDTSESCRVFVRDLRHKAPHLKIRVRRRGAGTKLWLTRHRSTDPDSCSKHLHHLCPATRRLAGRENRGA